MILSLIFPGLGQLYNGQWKKAIVLAVALILLPVTFGILHLTAHFWGFISLFFVVILFRLWITIDAARKAIPLKLFELRNYNRGIIYIGIAVCYSVFFTLFDTRTTSGVSCFFISKFYGEPTVLEGDYVIIDVWAYTNHNPQYGDLVQVPVADDLLRVYRVIGLPNDRVKVEKDTPIINGEKCRAELIDASAPESHFKLPNIHLQEWEEMLPNNHLHRTLKYSYNMDVSPTDAPEIQVPANCYFVMADNRGNALDSRFFGCIRREDILGQVVFSVWGMDNSRMGVDFREK